MKLESLPCPLAVARRVADRIGSTLASKAEAVVLLPAGTTPIELYRELVRRVRAGSLDLSRARLFQLDELLGIPPGDPRSFHGFFSEHLLEPLDGSVSFHGLDGACADPASEIERHGAELAALGGADLALLGLGKNGHVAFNEPGTRRGDAARVVELDPVTRAGLEGAFPNGAPQRGLTLGLVEILASRAVGVLVTGPSKAEVLGRVLGEEPSSALPASLLNVHADATVYADAEALRGS